MFGAGLKESIIWQRKSAEALTLPTSWCESVLPVQLLPRGVEWQPSAGLASEDPGSVVNVLPWLVWLY